MRSSSGAEIRRQNSWAMIAGVGTYGQYPAAIGGDAPNAPISTAAISTTNYARTGRHGRHGNNARMRNLLSFLSGSLGSITQVLLHAGSRTSWMHSKTTDIPVKDSRLHGNEFSFFFKDDWKVTKSLTLNLGLR